MKRIRFISILCLMAVAFFTACDNTPEIPSTPGNDNGNGNGEGEVTTSDTLTVAQAIQKNNDGTNAYVKGFIVGYVTTNKTDNEFLAGYPTDTAVTSNILIADQVGELTTYMTVQLPSGDIRNALNLYDNNGNLGKEVLLYGTLSAYFSTNGLKDITFARLDGKTYGVDLSDLPDCPDATGDTISVTTAYTTAAALASGSTSDASYYIIGVVSEVKSVSLTYGNAQFNITDGTNTLLCYNTYNVGNTHFADANQVAVGDIVVVYGKLQNYNGTMELATGGYIIRTTNTYEVGEVKIETITTTEAIAIANALASGASTDVMYDVTGLVISITEDFSSYGNITFEMADATGATSTLTCYRCYYLENGKCTTAGTVAVGDAVTVRGQVMNYKGTTPEISGGYIYSHNGNTVASN